MGDFLLSILGYNRDDILIYTRHVEGSRFKVGTPVSVSYPNPHRVPSIGYYRIYGKIYSTDAIRKLIDTQDSNIIDQDLVITPMHKHHRDKEMYEKVANGRSHRELAREYGWHHGAISLAVTRYRNWLTATTPTETTTPPLVPRLPTAEQRAKIDDMLANWGN